MSYRASLVIGRDGSTVAHVHQLMGCFALSRSKDRLLKKLESAIPQYYQWLREHGEQADVPQEVRIVVEEELRIDDSPGDAGGSDPLCHCDRIVATDHEIVRCLELLNYTRQGLSRLIEKLPKTVLKYKPRGEPRSVQNAIRHIADVDVWYLSRIGADPHLDESRRKDLPTWLEYTRNLVHQTLPNLTTEQRSRVFYPRKWSEGVWPWTATKVLHRLVTHERQHIAYLKRILGSPESPLNQGLKK